MPLGTVEALGTNDDLGRVLLLALVSGAETYFRTLLTRLLTVCEVSRGHASDQMLSLGAFDYYGADQLGFGLLEGISFVSEGEILRQTRRLTGLDWDEKSSVASAVRQFERLAHLRHAAVHARGELGARNARAIGVVGQDRKRLVVQFPQLQEAALVCLNAARAYNLYLFQKVVQRWIDRRKLQGSWEKDRTSFCRLLALFVARQDGFGGGRYRTHLYGHLQPAIGRALANMGRGRT